MSRYVNLIVVHCSATMPSMDIGYKEINQWHLDRGWDGCGYHYIVRRDGVLEWGRDREKQGAHVSGYNSDSLGVCMVGGIDDDGASQNNFTNAQFTRLKDLFGVLFVDYSDATVLGHRDLAAKDCPCFSVREFLKATNHENKTDERCT